MNRNNYIYIHTYIHVYIHIYIYTHTSTPTFPSPSTVQSGAQSPIQLDFECLQGLGIYHLYSSALPPLL